MTGSADRLSRWIFLLTAGFLFTATVLRSALAFAGDTYLVEVLLLLLVWLVLFALEVSVTARRRQGAANSGSRTSSWGPLFPLYLAAQTAIVIVLLARAESGDFYAVLFGVLSMQAMERLGWKTAVVWIALFAPLTALPLTLTYDVPQAVAFAFIYLGVNAFLAFFTFFNGRAAEARARNQVLADELRVANQDIQEYSRKTERLAATRERHRLARELHDSVTQTVFSMNLTAQSAALLLARDRSAASAQLERLEELTQSALAEIRTLGAELAQGSDPVPATLGEVGLAPALRRHLEERGLPDGLSVALDVEGEEAAHSRSDGAPPPEGEAAPLSAAEELGLFRIAQEALNNIVKHAQTNEAAIRLRLSPPFRLEIEDRGRGFRPPAGACAEERARSEGPQPAEGGGMGLASMRERAAEIGWSLSIDSAPGAGTRVVVERTATTTLAERAAVPVPAGQVGTERPERVAIETERSEGRLGE